MHNQKVMDSQVSLLQNGKTNDIHKNEKQTKTGNSAQHEKTDKSD